MKFIAFGCSFTNYAWITYADILKADNMGMPGSGNERIFYEILNCYKNNTLKDYDGIVVQWSGHNRFDYLTTNGWTEPDGAIMFSNENKYIWRNIKSWYNDKYEIEKTQNYIYSANAILEEVGIKKYFMSMNCISNPKILLNNLQSKYKGSYEFDRAPWTKSKFVDDHPTVAQHLEIANQCAEYFGTEIPKSTAEKCMQIHNKIQTANDWEDTKTYVL